MSLARALQPQTVLRGHSAEVQSAAFHLRDDVLFTGDSTGHVRCWNLDSTRSAETQAHPHDAGVVQIALFSGSSSLLTQGRDGCVKRWDVRDDGSLANEAAVLATHSHHFCRMALLQEPSASVLPARSLAVAGEDPACPAVWDVDTCKEVLRIPKNPDRGLTMALSLPEGAGPLLVAGCATAGCIARVGTSCRTVSVRSSVAHSDQGTGMLCATCAVHTSKPRNFVWGYPCVDRCQHV